jgi:hypothetical protein
VTDEQIEKLILDELNKRGITIYDMISLPNYGVDPNPEDKTIPSHQRTRINRFNNTFGSGRMKEFLCVGEYNPYDDYPLRKISLQDLFRFWWNRCVEKELVIDEILDDIYDYFTDQMRPPAKKEEEIELILDFDQLPLLVSDLDKAA